MHVLVITNDTLQQELQACPASAEVHWEFIGDLNEVPQNFTPGACIDLLFDHTAERKDRLKKLDCPLTVVNAVLSQHSGIDAGFIRINGWPGFLSRPLIEAAANEEQKNKAEELFVLLGRKAEWVPDISGFITARIVASIINEAFFALEENISTEEEIDTAMKLGTNYPFGPFEWGKKIGFSAVYSLLAELAAEETRYLPCKLLEKKALA